MSNSIVFNIGCDGIQTYPNKYFKLAIVDPPYGINRSGQKEYFGKTSKQNKKFFEDKKWDLVRPDKRYFDELFRVSENQIIWGANYFAEFLPPSMGWIFWDKGQDLCQSDGELAYTSFNQALRRVKINRNQLLVEGGTIHPTQKPIKLYDFCFKFAKVEKGDKILDTHLGSGSSRIAAYKAGLDFTGFEIDKEYYDAQEKRFKTFTDQLSIL